MSVFSEIASISPHQVWDGVLGRVVEGENATLAVIELEPGAVVPEHRHVNEQMGVLIEGSLTFRIGEETRDLAPGGMWCIPADVPHEVRVGPEGAVLVEAFAPRRADWAGLAHRDDAVPRWPS